MRFFWVLAALSACSPEPPLGAPPEAALDRPSTAQVAPKALDGDENTLALCTNGIGEGTDGLTDCADQDCAAFCTDNDNDGYCEVGEDDNDNGSCNNAEIDTATRDCDDTRATVSPGDPENTAALCTNGRDDDCDGATDLADSACALADVDNDGDGFCESGRSDGDGNRECTGPVVSANADCDDTRAAVAPGAPENTLALCTNGRDDDCDGNADIAEASCAAFWDNDTDGFCEGATCAGGATPGDCDDTRAEVNPSATEAAEAVCTNGRDDDCDGSTDLVDAGCALPNLDNDGDTYCENGRRDTNADGVCAGTASAANEDCDDTRADVSPADPEDTIALCGNGRDDDCDGSTDAADAVCAEFLDADGDGFCPGSTCAGGALPDDCDDADDERFPGATEVVGNGVDEDCDNRDDCFEDLDNDDHGSTTVRTGLTLSCTADAGNAPVSDDCDDGDDERFPSNAEVCDGADNDCDPDIDEGVQVTFYADTDGDTFGDPTDSQLGCTAPAGFVANDDDCDDADDERSPSATEVPIDGIDQDCDGFDACFQDLDGDGRGTTALVDGAVGCAAAGRSVFSDDCDDADAGRFPGNVEVCDGEDDNCAAGADEGLVFVAYKPDADGDGFGSSTAAAVSTCDGPPAGHVLLATDCDDGNPARFPGNPEVCDSIDNNCAGGVDEGLVFLAYRPDADGDGFGSASAADVTTCSGPPPGHVLLGTDCDDGSAIRFPGNPEVCDAVDNDCAGGVDDGLAFVAYYPDSDTDGFGAVGSTPVSTCSGPPAGRVADATDCDDAVAGVNPSVGEVPANAVDEDCDAADDCWLDADGDGFGVPTPIPGDDLVCTGPGESARTDDCDDADPLESPGQAWHADCDGDGAFLAVAVSACTRDEADALTACGAPLGGYANTAPAAPDCDDADAEEFPGQVWYGDCDADGVVQEPAVVACALADAVADTPCDDGAPDGGWSHDAPPIADCDDENDLRFPGNPEACEGLGQLQVDNDCDDDPNGVGPGGGSPTNASIFYGDFDLDGFGQPGPGVLACESRPGLVTNDADCDDVDPTVFVGAPEVCDGRDQNCNLLIDEADFLAPSGSFCIELYRDRDGDGYGDEGATQCLCVDDDALSAVYDGETYVATNTDCDDLHADIRPHECNDGADNDGDGVVDGNDPDCEPVDDGGVTKQPTVEGAGGGAFKEELLDGHDNDCDGFVAFVELDCDDDGSLPALPVQPGGGVFRAEELGLTACAGGPIQQPCWDETLTLECDPLTALWVTRWGASEDDFGGRFSNAYRNLASVGCDPIGDCDDRCPDRCPGVAERCDGVDNDCSGVALTPDTDGIPDALGAAIVEGTVASAELDRDGDGFAACVDDFRASSAQIEPTFAACTSSVVAGFDSDCDDLCALKNSQAVEWCNGFTDVCGASLSEGEGVDADRDGHRTCGARGVVDSELDEQLVVGVWIACDPGREGCEGVTAAAPAGVDAWVPLLRPRAEAPECDAPLSAQLDLLLAAVEGPALADLVDDAELAAVCDPRSGGVCAPVTLVWDPDVDLVTDGAAEDALATGRATATCVERPEQYVARAVWRAERIAGARRAVVEAECRRLYGVGCSFIANDQPMTGRPAPADANDLLDGDDLWWQEIGRFFPRTAEGAVLSCWGDPRDGLATLEEAVGGDCADDTNEAHRDQPEGPDDLLGIYLGEIGDCGRCTDGIDNNCDGRTDCEDPSCAVCFVGVGRGCDGGRDPCNPPEEGSGCRSAPVGGGFLVWLALLAGARRFRGSSPSAGRRW